jgi:hypothetical protein
MLKNILLACAVVALCACEDNKPSNNNNPDMAMGGGGNTGDMAGGGGGNPDMAPSCFDNPMTNDQLLNSCTTAAIDKVDITPFYPTLAPNGQLPTLQ